MGLRLSHPLPRLLAEAEGAARPRARAKKGGGALRSLLLLLSGPALVFGFTALTLHLMGRASRPPRTILLVVPEGTRERVARGENPLELPPTLGFVVGDTLVIRNLDSAAHRIGPFIAPPGEERAFKLGRASAGSLLCSLHPSGRLNLLRVEPRGVEMRLTLAPTLYLGLPLGFLALGLQRVIRRLGPEGG